MKNPGEINPSNKECQIAHIHWTCEVLGGEYNIYDDRMPDQRDEHPHPTTSMPKNPPKLLAPWSPSCQTYRTANVTKKHEMQ